MVFRHVFAAVVIATALLVAAFLIHLRRPALELQQPSAALIRASGKCAECHRRETGAVVHEYERSAHAAAGINCLDCHRPAGGQDAIDHRGFVLAAALTGANCAECHATEYEQYLRSRHAAPAWAAVRGAQDFNAAQIEAAERHHPGAVDRLPNALALLEGPSALASGCAACHDVGRPNPDGSIGSCTACHSRHAASVALARMPRTCGQCHMGPDHAQIEIYEESKHGVLFEARRAELDLAADPKSLTTRHMSVPTCATCHMSGLEGAGVTHDTTERLSYWLFAAVSEQRPNAVQAQTRMKEICLKCHARTGVDRFYEEAESVVAATNDRVKHAMDLMQELRAEGHLTPAPFDEPIEFRFFDLWHYFGRTAKHGAFMGGADFVQWHGNYELLLQTTELEEMARGLRGEGGDG